MRTSVLRFLGLSCALLLLPIGASGQEAGELTETSKVFKVTSSVQVNGQEVASPVLHVLQGKTGRITLHEGFDLEFTSTEVDATGVGAARLAFTLDRAGEKPTEGVVVVADNSTGRIHWKNNDGEDHYLVTLAVEILD